MRQLKLLMGCCVALLCWSVGATPVRPEEGKMGGVGFHKQAKLAGRAKNLDNPESRDANQKKVADQTVPERRVMSQEERRALRRQISETEVKYPPR